MMSGTGEAELVHSREAAHLLASIEEELLLVWLTHPRIEALFHKYGMDEPYFREHYGMALYRSFVQTAAGTDASASCPMIHSVIDYFKNRDIVLTDLHHFFSIYRQSILKLLIRKEGMGAELFDEVQQILDRHFHEALLHYNATFFSKDQELKKELIRFREYQKVIDRSAIVSKTDPKGMITYVNRAFCLISGYECEELIGQPHSLIRHTDSPSALFEEMWKAISAKKVFHATIKNRKKNGDSYYVDATVVPILDEENAIIEYISMSYDVTALIEAVETARIAQRVKDEFLANMSHEIRTPLNAIMGFIAILRKQVTDEKGAHYLNVIGSSSQMLLDIVNDILDLSKIQSGKFTVASEPFDPIAELSAAAALFGSKAQEKSIRYAVFIDPNLPTCLAGDGSRIKQILSNFLSNAIKFTPDHGTVKVKAVYEEGELRVNVQDNGIGVSPQKQATIFEAFEQADSSITRHFGGTGLGLSICSQLLLRMGGKIVFRSVENRGSLFGFHLPCPICPESSDTPPPVSTAFGGLRIGLVGFEHDRETAALIEKYLRAFGILLLKDNSALEEGGVDAIFCPDTPEWIERSRLVAAQVVIVQSGFSHLLEFPFFETLHEPFLPAAIGAALERIATRRTAASRN